MTPPNQPAAAEPSLHFGQRGSLRALNIAHESDQMDMTPVISDNVLAVGYESATSTLRVAFRSGGVYDYSGVDEPIFARMLQPHPWRAVGRLVKAHPYRQVG